MNYKKVISNQDLRLKILGMTEFIPDKLMIKLQYYIKMKKKLDLKKPKTFNEKIQWYKLYYRNPLMTQCADKYRVREYVSSKGLDEILIPLCGVYTDAEDINFNQLPEKFVLKTNNGSGTNLLCENKASLNVKEAKDTVNNWLHKRTAKAGREWAYYNIKTKIICEEYLEANAVEGLIDYKFYCFNGKPEFIKVATDSSTGEPGNGIFNMEFKKLPYNRKGAKELTSIINKPKNYERMIEITKKLSEDFPHVRVDLYNIDGKIYFGELTFYDNSGYQIFEPSEFDDILGGFFQIEKMKL